MKKVNEQKMISKHLTRSDHQNIPNCGGKYSELWRKRAEMLLVFENQFQKPDSSFSDGICAGHNCTLPCKGMVAVFLLVRLSKDLTLLPQFAHVRFIELIILCENLIYILTLSFCCRRLRVFKIYVLATACHVVSWNCKHMQCNVLVM